MRSEPAHTASRLIAASAAEIYRATGDGTDRFEGQFVELVPERRIVERVRFESEDPAFAGEMRLITTLEPEAGGTRVTLLAEDVPSGISAEDHAVGMASAL